jgi:hypothetical protein
LIVYKGMLSSLERGLSLIEAVEDHYWGVSTTKTWNRLIDRQIEELCGYHEQLLWKWEGKMKPGASAAVPPPEASILLSELIGERSEDDMITRSRLLVITSAVFTYEERLRRLDKLMEQWLHREAGIEQAEEV